ncbi:MAG: hypothetical protein NTW44_08390 [Nitrospirae bacterium]|nr:hypothetical protein [Nitrospirota bacterium]
MLFILPVHYTIHDDFLFGKTICGIFFFAAEHTGVAIVCQWERGREIIVAGATIVVMAALLHCPRNPSTIDISIAYMEWDNADTLRGWPRWLSFLIIHSRRPTAFLTSSGFVFAISFETMPKASMARQLIMLFLS